jgi:hypothetical protein
MKNTLIGFGLCLLVVSVAANVAMYKGYLIDKTKLQITICTAVSEAVARAEDDSALVDAISKRTK